MLSDADEAGGPATETGGETTQRTCQGIVQNRGRNSGHPRTRVTPQREAELWECVYLDGKQVADLLAYVKAKARHPWIFPLFAFAAFTGARISEMCRTLVEDVNFDAVTVRLREKKKCKGMSTFRKVPLASPLVLALRKWLEGHLGGPLLFCKPAHIQPSR